MAQSKSERSQNIVNTLEMFNQAVQDLQSVDNWQFMLDSVFNFRRYSFRNMMLILSQNPDATNCAGFRTWKEMGYSVRKGEKGLRILAPRTVIVKDEDGQPVTENGKEKRKTYFTSCTVFDVSQVEPMEGAQPLPAGFQVHQAETAETADKGLYQVLEAFITSQGWTVVQEPLGANLGGFTQHKKRRISINSLRTSNLRASTLAHEIAHALMHEGLDMKEYAANHDGVRSLAETEAESVAHIVTRAWGLDVSTKNVPYVAGWSSQDTSVLQKAAENVVKTARVILDAVLPLEEKKDTE